MLLMGRIRNSGSVPITIMNSSRAPGSRAFRAAPCALAATEEKEFIPRETPYCDYEERKAETICGRGILIPDKEPRRFTDRSLKEISPALKGFREEELECSVVNEVYGYRSQVLDRKVGSYTIAVTCTENPETEKFARISLTAVTGPEVITGSTRMKAGTAQKLILNMLSTGSMILMGKVYGNLMVDLQCTNEKLKARARRILMEVTGCDPETAELLLEKSGGSVKPAILMHLSGIDYPEAVEKLKENHGSLKQALR